MLAKARQILVSELVFAMGLTEAEAERTLDEHLPYAYERRRHPPMELGATR
jgi:RNA polymerase-interacting CarD/CdnL/TRCF family regulator